jgi:hypothetical protein
MNGRRRWWLLFSFPWLALAFTGCGGNAISGSAAGGLEISPGSLSFGSVSVGKTATASVSLVNLNSSPVQISAINVTGKAFSVSAQNSLPLTLAAAGGTYSLSVTFNPSASGAATGQVSITSNAGTDSDPVIGLSGMGLMVEPPIGALTCANGTILDTGTDACAVTLSAAAPSGGITVNLSSSSPAISVPASVNIAAGATSANFLATASTVTAPQTVILTASEGGVSENTDVEVEVANPALTVSATSLAFGNVSVNSASTQTVTVTSTGAAAVTVNSATITGTGFTVSAPTLPVTLTPGNSTSLTVQFDPTVAGAETGQLTIVGDASSGNSLVNLTGTGVPVLTGVSCSNGSFTGSGTDACSVTLNAAAATGGFAVGVASNNAAVSVPSSVTVAAGSATGSFTATVSSVSTTQTATITATAGSVTKTFAVDLNASTSVPVLSAISCTNSSMTGSGTDACTVTLNAAAASGGFSIGLSSNNSAVSVPSSVTVSSGSTTGSFSATVSSVLTAQAVTLTASAGTVTKTFALALNAYVATLGLNTTSITFGDVTLNSPATQTLNLTSSGGAPVTISQVSISGAGFTFSGVSFPLTLNSSNPSANISVEFDPTADGAASGQLTITSNSSTGTSTSVSLSGTGVTGGTGGAYQVEVTWEPPASSSDAVAGYNIYRTLSGNSNYQLMGSVNSGDLSYQDSNNIQDGQSYVYIVESVDASGNESVPSNMASVSIPN